MDFRSGKYVKTGSIRAFRPAPLPPKPAIEFDAALTLALSRADRALARLDGAVGTLPDPEMLVYAFMRQEAVLSSQIEGTQASLEDLLEFEVDDDLPRSNSDVHEVIRYLDAMKWAVSEIEEKPISLNLIKGAHSILLQQGRGSSRNPGEFRQNQNWIGPPGCALEEATYIPPSVPDMHIALDNLEKYINSPDGLPDLVQCALIHAQFETIHPFWDGNGRLGRMLITLLLCQRGVLELPILYLSLFFKQHRQQYYDHLQAIRDKGAWEEWVIFFLRGVTVTSRSALSAAREIRSLRERMVRDASTISSSPNAVRFGEMLFESSYLTARVVSKRLQITPPTAHTLIDAYKAAGYLIQVNNGKRDRVFAFKPYLDILHNCADDLSEVIGDTDYLATSG
ncbi:MAG: Fic family protein [Aquisalinus sp.]|nr:Fic family protein [Aquisalinus sp.]